MLTKNRSHSILRIAATALAVIVLPRLVFDHEHWVFNTTDCLPLGIYKEQPAPTHLRVGEIVEFCPDLSNSVVSFAAGRNWLKKSYGDNACSVGGYAPLMKKVAALPGDIVTVTKYGVAINGVSVPHALMLQRTLGGAGIPNIGYGSYTVPAGQFFALADNDPRAFDSRYFGAVKVSEVTHIATPVLTATLKHSPFTS